MSLVAVIKLALSLGLLIPCVYTLYLTVKVWMNFLNTKRNLDLQWAVFFTVSSIILALLFWVKVSDLYAP